MAPGWFGYSVIRNSVGAEFYRQLLAMCETMDFGIEGLHEETGPGVIEAAIGYDGALAAADKAALFKTFVKVLAQRNAHDGDVHGEVVARLAGPERPHPSVAALARRRQAGVPRRVAAALDERDACGTSSAVSSG